MSGASGGARVMSVATAVPTYQLNQRSMKEFGRRAFSLAFRTPKRLEKALGVFDTVGVERRRFCVPLAWAEQTHSFAERMRVYKNEGTCLSYRAASEALERAGADPRDVGTIVFVSSTGISTPSIGSDLVEDLGLPESVRKVPPWGLGCAGGAAGLSIIADLIRPGELSLLVAMELSSLAYMPEDSLDPARAMTSLVGTALFADGAAAAVVGRDGEGPEVVARHSTTWRRTRHFMGWEVLGAGLGVLLSTEVPGHVRRQARASVEDACRAAGIELGDVAHPVVHPGSSKVLDALEEALGLPDDALGLSREVLRDHGNMSSVTVLFVLERLLNRGRWGSGEFGLLSAMGPGFAAEHVVLRF